jgi:hypothetical protein
MTEWNDAISAAEAAIPDRATKSTRYDMILACRQTGQIDDKAWEAHLQDEHFAAWVKKQERTKERL